MKLDLLKIRRELHSLAELSGKEQFTSQYIFNLILKLKPDRVITNIAGYGLVFVFKGSRDGKNIAFRADIDAVPVNEENNFNYRSNHPNVSHKCGHDGHSTILIGLAERLSKREFSGQVFLIFQPSEETGQGAEKMLSDSKFKDIELDYIFAIHNIPGYEKSTVLIKDGVFAGSSIGLKVKLMGVQCHASEPDKGVSPSLAVAELIKFIESDLVKEHFIENSIANIVYVNMGVQGFGVLPAQAELWITVRAVETEVRDTLVGFIQKKVGDLAEIYNLNFKIDFSDNFNSTINHVSANKIVEKSAKELNLNVFKLAEPFKWSEDFGRFTEKYEGALIGLGAGIKCKPLHNPHYDFPDEITKTGVNLLEKIIFTVND